VQYSAVQYSTVQYSTVKYSTIKYNLTAIDCGTTPGNLVYKIMFIHFLNFALSIIKA
jgi:hypothetical protein